MKTLPTMDTIIVFIIIFFIIFLLISIRPAEIISRWHHYFDEFQFSSTEFYTAFEHGIKRREIPNVLVGRNNYFEGGVLSQQRVYFKVSNGQYIFDVCAAPYGKSFFVSWWLKESKSVLELLLERFFPWSNRKTYYQLDIKKYFCTIRFLISNFINQKLKP